MATKDEIKKRLDEDQDVGKTQFYGQDNQNVGTQQSNSAVTHIETPKVEATPSSEKESYLAGNTNTSPIDAGKKQFMVENTTAPTATQEVANAPSTQQREQSTLPTPLRDKVDKELKVGTSQVKPPSIEDIIEKTAPKRQLSDEDKAIIERRANREALIGAISDGLSAMANLFFTGKGGTKSAYDASSDLAPRAKKRWDKWIEQRNAEMERIYQDYQAKEKERKAEERAKQLFAYNEAKDKRDYQLNAQKVENDRVSNVLRAQEIANLAEYRATQNANQKDKLALEKVKETNRTALSWAKVNATKPGQKISIRVSEDETIEANSDLLKNDASVASLFRLLPQEVQATAGKPRYNQWGEVVDYYPPTKAEMLRAIGDNVPINKELREAVQKSTETVEQKPKAQTPKKDFSAYKVSNENNTQTDFSQYKRK